MLSHKLGRRFRSILFSRLFICIILLFIVVFAIYIIFFTSFIKKKQTVSDSASVSPHLAISFIKTSPNVSTDSGIILISEIDNLNNPPFQINGLSETGEISNQIDTSSPSALVYCLIDQFIPTQDDFSLLYQTWSLLNQSQTEYQHLWLSDHHLAILFSDSLLAVLPDSRPVTESLNTLQQIRFQSTMNLNHAIIDLRYDKPVVSINQTF